MHEIDGEGLFVTTFVDMNMPSNPDPKPDPPPHPMTQLYYIFQDMAMRDAD